MAVKRRFYFLNRKGLLEPELANAIRSASSKFDGECMSGVNFLKSEKVRYGKWIAKANICGKTVKRSFSEGVFGYEGARAKAIEARRELLARKQQEELEWQRNSTECQNEIADVMRQFENRVASQTRLQPSSSASSQPHEQSQPELSTPLLSLLNSPPLPHANLPS
jgi:hypothetical protein